MKEIKFRVWHKTEKRFVNYISINFYEEQIGYDANGEFNYRDLSNFKDVIIQKSTEILDKNGQEIYEGDICRYILKESGEILQQDIGAVIFKNCAFRLDGSKFGHEDHYLEDYITEENKSQLEVIGNIFEENNYGK